MSMSLEVYKGLSNSYTSWICCQCGLPNFSSSLFESSSSLTCTNNYSPLSGQFTPLSMPISPPIGSSSPRLKGPIKQNKPTKASIPIANFPSFKGKSSQLEALLESYGPLDIICGSESHLDPNIGSSEIFPPHYTVIRKDRNTHGGGVLIALKSDLNVVHRTDLDTDCEIIWAELITRKDQSVLIGSFYRPPNTDLSVLQELENSIEKAHHAAKKAPSDFNLPGIDWDIHKTKLNAHHKLQCQCLLDIADDFHLRQLVKELT